MNRLQITGVIVFAFIILLFSGCDPDTKEFTETPISGKLYYQNTLLGYADYIPLPNTDVYLTDKQDFTTYLYNVKTDSTGYFKFTHSTKGTLYLVAEHTAANVRYAGTLNATDLKGKFVLLPDSNQGLIVTVLDENEQPLNNATVCLFTNSTAALTGNCDGAITPSGTTNSLGSYFFPNLPANTTYYANVLKVAGQYNYVATGSKLIPANTTQPERLTLFATRKYGPKLKIEVKDDQQQIVNGLNVCLFVNTNTAANGNCAPTNGLGIAEFTMLGATDYYVHINETIGNWIYTFEGWVTFAPNSLTDITRQITVTRTAVTTSRLLVILTDAASTPMNNMRVCVFTSATFANSGTCTNSVASNYTNNLGRIEFTNLPTPQKYYVAVHDTIDQVIYTGLNSKLISNSSDSILVIVN
ncbi:MAG TPA: hypothetical protein VK174_09915 [Chitinophagales bacterium]|nr:hypothetical protein [Chitinophagales bacterium]